MARNLYIKQKKFLDDVMRQRKVYSYSDLTFDEQEVLDAMNIYENIISDVDRYISDKNFEKLRG